jgi:hypothetical protein
LFGIIFEMLNNEIEYLKGDRFGGEFVERRRQR